MNYSTSGTFLVGGGLVLPMLRPPLPGGGVLVQAGKIAGLLNSQEFRQALASGNQPTFLCANSLIMPGLFNLHCHLDYTNLNDINDELALFDWLEILVKRSRSLTREDLLDSASHGAEEAALYGTSFLVDSTFSGMAALALARTGLRGLVGLELFGLDHEKAHQSFNSWLERYANLEKQEELQEALKTKRLELTVAPHAPYTVCPALWELALNWAKAHKKMHTAHLAESKFEIDWLCSRSLRLNNYLQTMLPPNSRNNLLESLEWKGLGRGAIEHLAHHNLLHSSLLAAHLVHLKEGEITLLSQHSVKAAICARSNERLLNGQPPISKFKSAELNFGLGSDSKASSPNLSMLDEAHFYAQKHKISLYETFLQLTLHSAVSLGKAQELGSLCPGKEADLAVFPAQALVDITHLQGPYAGLLKQGLWNEKILTESELHVQKEYSPAPDLAFLHYLQNSTKIDSSTLRARPEPSPQQALTTGPETQSDKNLTPGKTPSLNRPWPRSQASFLWVGGEIIVQAGEITKKEGRLETTQDTQASESKS